MIITVRGMWIEQFMVLIGVMLWRGSLKKIFIARRRQGEGVGVVDWEGSSPAKILSRVRIDGEVIFYFFWLK